MQGYQPLLETFNDQGRMHSLTFYLWLQYIADIELAVKYFTDHSKAVQILWIFFFCLVFAMPLCISVYKCIVVTCCERADHLALLCGVLL